MMLDGVTAWVQDVIEQLGALGVALLVVLENLFPPIPSEIVLPFAGFVAQRGSDSVVVMIAAATAGSTLGALILYVLAAWFGHDRVRRFVLRFGKWFTIREADLDRAERWFERRSMLAVTLGRCVPLVRSLVSLPAGFYRMPLVPYIVGTTIGSLAWNTAPIGAGAALGSRWELVEQYVGYFQYVVVLAIVVGALWYFLRRRAARD